MDHEIKCYPTQFIDEHGAFRADKLDNFIKQVELGECGTSYVVVAMMGPQSSGKSTLLNHLFHTNFTEMNAEEGRCQTTRGIWIARCVGIEPRTIVLDLEGTDGHERGEDDTAFENQSALFLLAICDIVLINIWCHDIGREHASNKPLLRTVFMAMLRLFAPRKTTLIFVVRDKTKTPCEKLDSYLKEDIQKIWDGIPKPEAHKHTPLSDVFNIQVVVLDNYEVKEEQFIQQVANMRQKFIQSIAPGCLAGDRQVVVHASDFSFSAQHIWDIIMANKDLDIPAHNIMLATMRCEEIADGTYSCFVSNKVWIETNDDIQSHPVQSLPNEESMVLRSYVSETYNILKKLFHDSLSSYDDATSHYYTNVRSAKRNQLEEKLVQLVQPAYQLLLEHLQSAFLKDFKMALNIALNEGQEFAIAARDCTKTFTSQFNKEYASIKQASWDSTNIGVRFYHDIDSHVAEVRNAKLSELTTQYKLKLDKALYGPVGDFLKHDHGGDVWPEIRKRYKFEIQKVESYFCVVLSSFGMDEHGKADMISELLNYAREQVEQITKEVAKEVSHIMMDRFISIFNHDKDLCPRSWTEKEDIQAIKRTAETSSLRVLSVLAAVRLDEDTDTIYDTLVHTLLDEPRSSSLASSSWPKISAAKTIITPLECKSLWVKFLSDTKYAITQANASQKAYMEADELSKKSWVPYAIGGAAGLGVVALGVGVVACVPAAPVAAVASAAVQSAGRVIGTMVAAAMA